MNDDSFNGDSDFGDIIPLLYGKGDIGISKEFFKINIYHLSENGWCTWILAMTYTTTFLIGTFAVCGHEISKFFIL